MGCGQSKINLYPRKNKNGGKGSNSKKSGAAEKETDEEEGSAAGAAPPEDNDEEKERAKHILPLSAHPVPIEVSASQQDFFKMLDEKIDKGKDYDSSSETEIQLEKERRKILINQWRSASLSTQSSSSYPSPPTPARRCVHRPVPQPPERHHSPGTVRRCYKQQHVPDGMSPPPRRAHSAQSHHQSDQRTVNGDGWQDPTKSPVKRPQSAGSNWKNAKPSTQSSSKRCESIEHQRSRENNSGSSQDVSQITFNPTFQTHSPAHSAKPQQPYIAQIITYPMSQQVAPPSPPKYIAPPEEYQDPQNKISEKSNSSQKQISPPQTNTQSQIYYIHGNQSADVTQDLVQQRQQTAFHLQQYVAMKQAQQHMFTYMQRGPSTVYPHVEYVQTQQRPYEGEEYTQQYGHPTMRPQSAPTPIGVVRPMPVTPGYPPLPDGSHMMQMPIWSHMPPVVSTMGPWISSAVSQEVQYYTKPQFVPVYRPNSAGSAGTLTRYQKKDTGCSEVKNMCQSINLVRQKPIGQIVSLPGQELSVCNSASASNTPSPASISTDSGVSPGNSAPSSKTSVFSAPTSGVSDYQCNLDNKNKKNKAVAYNTKSLKNSKSLDS